MNICLCLYKMDYQRKYEELRHYMIFNYEDPRRLIYTVPEFLKNDIDFMFTVVEKELQNNSDELSPEIKSLSIVSADLLDSKEFALKIFLKYSYCHDNILYFSPRLLDDKQFLLELMAEDPVFFTYASDRLKVDIDIIRSVVECLPNKHYINSLPQISLDNENVIRYLVHHFESGVPYMSNRLKKDQKFIYKLLKEFNFDHETLIEPDTYNMLKKSAYGYKKMGGYSIVIKVIISKSLPVYMGRMVCIYL